MTMKKMLMFAFAVSLATACSKKEPSCEDVFEHTKSLAPEGFREQMEAKKDKSIAKCEKLSADAKKCAMDAKTMEDLQKCPRD
jgi:hypothetical protein